ncbi:hypothetical protein [Planococcus citreus]|uniref:YhfM-like domain-containing protein n=1 Tax=Planococcus citreus TaxID=1373 RepID=A0A497YLT1_9BACL|nr:hypothetical protein [Planococcus citreus]RLJ90702.1 hypothetical protein DFR62_0850 [Planococcus citreus]
MRKLQVLSLLLIMLFTLTACQNGLLNAEQQSVDKIVLYQMESFGQVKENTNYEITDKQTIKLFATAISRANKVSGIADVVDPNFKVEFGEKEFYMWVSANHGSVMDEADTHTLYTLEQKDAEQLYSFLSSENLLD